MALLNFHKKAQANSCNCEGDTCCTTKQAATDACCCAGDDCCTPEETSGCCCSSDTETTQLIQVLGGGCKNCHKLMDHVHKALETLGLDEPVELVMDMAVIAGYGVMSTPALVVDGKVVSTGRVLSPEQAAEAIQSVRNQ